MNFEIPVGPFLQPIKFLLNGSTTLCDRLGVLIFLLGHLPLLPLLVYYFLMSEISEELLAHLCRPPATTALFPGSGDGSFLSLEDVIHDNQLGILHHCSPQDCVPWDSSKQAPEQASVCSPEPRAVVCRLVVLFTPLGILNSTISWPLQPRLFMTFTLDEFFLVCKY